MNKKQLLEDYINCLKQKLFWERIMLDVNYEDLFSKKEIQEQIDYYNDQLNWLRKELKNYGNKGI